MRDEPSPRDGASGGTVPASDAHSRLSAAPPSAQEAARFDSYDYDSYDYRSYDKHSHDQRHRQSYDQHS